MSADDDRAAAAAAGGPGAPLLPAWDDQQAAYIADREGRFRIIASLVELRCGPAPLVVDLACGPGSLSARLLDALPGARVLGVDHDPLLLELARRELAPRCAGRLTLLDADLEHDGWPDAVRAALGGAAPDAIVSTTALHWLVPARLIEVYAQAAALLADGGVLLNGDHFRFDGRAPRLRALAASHDEATQRAAHAAGALSWDAWWERARAIDGGAELAAERARRFDHRPPPPTTAVDLHLAALAQAGFAEVGTVWQLLDDYVVAGFKG